MYETYDEENGNDSDTSIDIRQSIARYLLDKIGVAQNFIVPDHEFVATLKISDGVDDDVEFPIDDIGTVEPAEEQGTFLVHFKNEMTEHKVRTLLVTGAAIIVCAASIRQIKKNN